MDRRTILKSLALLGAAAVIPFRKLAAFPSYSKRPYHQFKLGELELMVLADGHINLSPVQPNFPNGTEKAEKELLQKSFRSTDAVDLGMNILLVKKENDFILIDTGTGSGFGPSSGWLLQSMEDAGIKPENITHIIISHAHPDHIGGLVKAEKSVFPAATIHLSRIEHAFWMAAKQDFSKSKFQDKDLLAKFTAITQQTFKLLQSQLHLFEDKAEILGCIRMELAPGHTPGHCVTHIYSGSDQLVHIADLVHSDVLLFPHPEWGFNGDTDIELATKTRRRVMKALADSRTKAIGYHLPWPGLGHVRTNGNEFEWVAETYAFPA
ncbi:MBL fold metallo-hydrolase [Chitinophaga sancti]|uniref:Glyoxylase, beta-lactamase superfamily II n=1 Tax=Chitinophaga sancti TaxID=1004 RepID=A0A1K1MXG1_9BACT|nr:MBL fold metallo-hydrolase [Chitinophaga sancti]WQD63069.1 MBL fold metallo-hydrolase [Chitinophaga sancti]WQG91306.1 MBL fold metallo-hydrolase [Chitinophaga sancti]SFW27729.1 Glyoxylase, beta-lactamase superfamily II [Chitinophaga sancti]